MDERKHRIGIYLTQSQAAALRDRLVPIAPYDYSLDDYAFLRDIYGRLDSMVLNWDDLTKAAERRAKERPYRNH